MDRVDRNFVPFFSITVAIVVWLIVGAFGAIITLGVSVFLLNKQVGQLETEKRVRPFKTSYNNLMS